MSRRDAGALRAIVLAAGFGSRLGAQAAHRHKCLTPVGGHPILARTLDTLAAAGVGRVTLVVGHLGSQVHAYATAWSGRLDLHAVTNDRVASTGTAYSLALGLTSADRGTDPGEDILVIEADVVFGAVALARLLGAPRPNATLVAPFAAHLTGSAVLCHPDATVRDWLHASHQGPGFRRAGAFKTVNLTRLDGPTAGILLDHCRSAGPRAPLEYALRALVQARRTYSSGAPIQAVDVQGAPWCEVDTPEDLHLAEDLFGAGAAAGR
jgi:choline kinase